MITCPICKNSNEQLRTLESNCMFLEIEGVNQHIIRYQCDSCDVIFGSEEMIGLEKDKLMKAYLDIYSSGYRECDSSSFEFLLFTLLRPTRDGVYINWGAGTSTTSEIANTHGFTLLNYDPGLPDSLNYLTKDKISTMSIDGIISNNVLDHLQDPINELSFMKSILKPGKSMIHGSDGFQYRIHWTKFHLYFFIGRSVQVMSDTIGMTHEFIPSFTTGVDIVKWNKP